jgi:hypothetical protein
MNQICNNILSRRRSLAWLFAPSVALLWVTASRPASADLEVVSEVHVTPPAAATGNATPNPATSAPVAFTTYFKGRRARLTRGDNTTVTIFDRDADRVYTLDPANKTYYVRSFKDAFRVGSTLPDAISSRFDLDTDIKLEEAKKGENSAAVASGGVGGSETQTIAGREAEDFTLSGYAALKPKETAHYGNGGMGGGFPSGGSSGGGHHHGGMGGGFPSGGKSGGSRPTSASGRSGQRLNVDGDVYTVDAEKLLPNGKKDEKEMSLAVVTQMLPGGSPLLEDLAKQLARKGRFPLASTVTLRPAVERLASDTNAAGSTNAPGFPAPGPVPPATVIHMAITSLRTDVTLDEGLFTLPTDYQKVDPPAPTSPFAAR